jgi:inosine-uridine nucleoside N-ribohydrolase
MALLLALSASPEELELAMISVTYGNVPLQWYAFKKMNCQPSLLFKSSDLLLI